MADDTRTKIMLLVAQEQELCVCELICALDQSQPKISRHLAVLRSGGLLADRRQGQWVYYRLHPDLPAWAKTVISTTCEANRTWLKASFERLAAMGDRPVRAAACC
jgi:ArsR family transcriptional regulator